MNYYKENYDYDPDEANRLLDEAGWKDSDGDGIREKDGTKLSFTFDDRDTESAKAIGQSLQIDMKVIGIDMQIVLAAGYAAADELAIILEVNGEYFLA